VIILCILFREVFNTQDSGPLIAALLESCAAGGVTVSDRVVLVQTLRVTPIRSLHAKQQVRQSRDSLVLSHNDDVICHTDKLTCLLKD